MPDERILAPEDARRTSRRKTKDGIKAIIAVDDLQSILTAAKRWQAKVVDEGGEASKLLHHIANAEKVMVKYRNRKKLAFERRREAREAEAALLAEPSTMPNQPGVEIAAGNAPTNTLGDALGKVLGVFKKPQEERPTRW